MSEVKRFDVRSLRSLIQGEQAVMGYEVVLASDYDALAAEAQALRDERDSQQRVAIKAMEELAALRARVVVTPDASTVYAVLDARERLFTSPENIQVALEAQSRLNGKTVSEGLLRRIAAPVNNQDELDAVHEARIELRALLNQDKENGNG
ncbi:hypothetical protein KUT99_05745 [Pseudomonas aeruginosa]|nr:hypothetical protein [Pseudomonas aeruginosa]MBV5930480.1 hypothetical protein [Pseudomonas aeruginosa]